MVGGTTGTGTNDANYIEASSITATTSGRLFSLGLNIETAAGNIRLGLYSTYSGGVFSGLLCQSASTSAVAGWNDLSVTSIKIIQGKTYYLAWLCDSNSLKIYYDASSTDYYVSYAYNTFPDPTGTLTVLPGVTFNIRMTYEALKEIKTSALGSFF